MTTPSIAQAGTATEALNQPYDVVLGSAPTNGNVLVAFYWTEDWLNTDPIPSLSPGSWTQDAAGEGYNSTQYGGPGGAARIVALSRQVGSGESGTITVTPSAIASSVSVYEVADGAWPPTVSTGTATVTATIGGTLSAVAAGTAMFMVGWGMQRTGYAPADSVNPLPGNTELRDGPSAKYHSWVGYGTAAGGTIYVGGTPASNANLNKWGIYEIGYLFAGQSVTVPVAQFIGSPTSGNAPLTVQFTDQSSNTPTSWSWDFGDSTSGTAQHPSHVYAAGTYTVSLVATNGSGSGTATRTAYITAILPEPGLSIGTAAVFSDRAIDWRISRGASPEITGGASIGQATITVQNFADDQFNPENGSSPIAGDLVDGTPIWIGVNEDGRLAGTAVRGLFGGYITDVTPIAVPGSTYPPTVEISAEDVLGRLSRTRVSLPLSRDRSHGELREAILDAADVTERDLGSEIETMPVSGADGYALGELEALNRATGTRHFIKPGDSATSWYTYVARDRQWNLSGDAQGTITAGMRGVNPPSGWRRSADTVINQQRVTFTPVAFTPAQVTVWEAEVLPFTVTSGDREFWIQFDAYVDAPTVDLSYSGATVISTLTSFGDTARLVVSSAGTAEVTTLSVEGSLARRAPDESFVASDPVSQALPRGVRSGSDISGDYVGTLASARGLAEHIVWRYSDPQVRPTVTVTNWLPEQFDLDLFDVVEFNSSQIGVANRLFEIVGITHEGRHAGTNAIQHTTTYVLQECRAQTDPGWFVLDSSLLDGTDILAY